MTEPTPDEVLAAAAERLRQPVSPDHPALVAPALARPLATWLAHATAVVLADRAAATQVFADDAAGRDEWLRWMHRPEPVAVARAILAPTTAPRGAPDAPPAPRVDTGATEGETGAQAATQAVGAPRIALDDLTSDQLDALYDRLAALDRVRAIHTEFAGDHTCYVDGERWPCPTVRAINGDNPKEN